MQQQQKSAKESLAEESKKVCASDRRPFNSFFVAPPSETADLLFPVSGAALRNPRISLCLSSSSYRGTHAVAEVR